MKTRFNIRLLILILVLCSTNTTHLLTQEKEIAKQGADNGIKAGINFAEF